MTIKEVEEKTGIARSCVRFYEKEKLIQPARNSSNGYREYTEEDVSNIKKIAYLRTLGISLENIHRIIDHKASLQSVIQKQAQLLENQITDLENSKAMCKKLLSEHKITYETLDVEAYVPELTEYWKINKKLFQFDSVSFLYMWGGSLTWGIITAACFLIALFAYPHLPDRIPIQWNDGKVSSEVGRLFIFAYPAACVIIRFLLRPFIWRWVNMNWGYSDAVSDYVSNYLCFIAISAEAFTIFYVYGIMQNIAIVFLADTVVLIGILLTGWKNFHLLQK